MKNDLQTRTDKSAAYLRQAYQGRPMDPKKIGLFPFCGFNNFDPHPIAQMDSQRVCITLYNRFNPILVAQKMSIHIWLWYLKCFLWAISEIIQNGGSVGSNPSQPSGSLEIVSGTSSRCWGSFRSLSRLRSWTQSKKVPGWEALVT